MLRHASPCFAMLRHASPCFAMLLTFFVNSVAFSQSFCGTSTGAGSIGQINGAITSSTDEPIYLRIYVHSIGNGGGSDFPSDEEIKQSINTKSWARSIATLYGRHFPVEIEFPIIERGQPTISESLNETWLKVQPNPARDFVIFSLSLSDVAVDVSIYIYDINGKLLVCQKGLDRDAVFEWNCERNPSGIYFYKLASNSNFYESGKILLNK